MLKKKLKILVLGDVFGKMGRAAVTQELPKLKKKYKPDLVLANAENLSHGNGVSIKTLDEMVAAGVDAFTSGNHIYDKTEVALIFQNPAYKLIRPLNFVPDSPGPGTMELTVGNWRILVINLIGIVYMKAQYDNPFTIVDDYLRTIDPAQYNAILVDMHADASSEKVAMGYHLDGKVSAVYGTHTHVPTADSRILPGGTAYLSDVGMTGALDGIIGMSREDILEQFIGTRTTRGDVQEDGGSQVNALYLEIDPATRKTVSLERINNTF